MPLKKPNQSHWNAMDEIREYNAANGNLLSLFWKVEEILKGGYSAIALIRLLFFFNIKSMDNSRTDIICIYSP